MPVHYSERTGDRVHIAQHLLPLGFFIHLATDTGTGT